MKEVFIVTPRPWVQSVRHGAEAWGKELEEAGHAASSLRKQKELIECWRSALFLFYLFWDSSPRSGAAHMDSGASHIT